MLNMENRLNRTEKETPPDIGIRRGCVVIVRF